MSENKPTISFRVTWKIKEEIDEIAKEYNTSISAIMRTLIADVLDNEIDEDTEFRPYKRRIESKST